MKIKYPQLDIELVKLEYFVFEGKQIVGWVGSAVINGRLFIGEFQMIEEFCYPNDILTIDWSNYVCPQI